jgi:elongator complex protein 2
MNVAEIWLWHINTWRVAGRLQSHSLTVTQLEFSSDNRFLLLVSRDRHFSVFHLTQPGIDLPIFSFKNQVPQHAFDR